MRSSRGRATSSIEGAAMTRVIGETGTEPTARVLNIQRMSTEDGPGIRTTVFFKGCGLSCLWCHNPESISAKPQVQWVETKCIGCGTCIAVCPQKALRDNGNAIEIDRDLCTGCGKCADECPATAMEFLGKPWRVDELVAEVEKDRAYFENSGGGVTASGGDPTVQAPFVEAFLKGCMGRGLHTALDTCGMCSFRALENLLPYSDLVLYDLKEMDPLLHEKFTGSRNERIIENLLSLRDVMRASGRPSELWLRTPLIPGATATEENITEIGRFIAGKMGDTVSRWELCSFNNLCRDKYRRLGLDWTYKSSQLLTREFLDRLTETARRSGIDPRIVQWTGATRVEGREDASREKDGTSHLRLVKGCPSC